MPTLYARSLVLMVIIIAPLLFCATEARALTCDQVYSDNFQTCLYAPLVSPSVTSNSITLTWLPYGPTYSVPDAIGISRGGKVVFHTGDVNKFPHAFVDSGLASKTAYTYTICAYWTVYTDLNGGSHPDDPESHPNNSSPAWECENLAYATTAPPPPPPPPPDVPGAALNLRIGARTSTSLEVLWTNPPRTQAYSISWYTGYEATPTPTTPDAAMDLTINHLSVDWLYTIIVCEWIRNKQGAIVEGPCSQVQGKTAAPAPAPMPMPDKPSGVTVYRATPSVVVVQWKADTNDYHQVERRLLTAYQSKSLLQQPAYSATDWMKVGPTIPKSKLGYSDIANAPSAGSLFEYRVCGARNVYGPASVPICSNPVEVGSPPPPNPMQFAPH